MCVSWSEMWFFLVFFTWKASLSFLFYEIKTSAFSLLVWLSNFLQNIRKFGIITTLSKLRDLAQSFRSLFVHKLLLNRILLICYTSDQKLFWVTLSSHMTEVIVFFVEKRQKTDAHSNYSVEHSSVKAVYREIKKNSVNDNFQRLLEKTKKF
jgi:hypothetical protein